jgi:two-component system cell cycle sensor histidine kinase/response regulator CckA
MSKLLLIEDNILLLETTRELLEVLGHQVFTAANGQQARELMAVHGTEVELVLLDLSLPDVAGEDLLSELAGKFPNLKVVLCTGSSIDENLRSHPAVSACLEKPFELRHLQEALDRALDIQP